jgi:hypothetical protein
MLVAGVHSVVGGLVDERGVSDGHRHIAFIRDRRWIVSYSASVGVANEMSK